MDKLFEQVGFCDEYREKFSIFYKPYFENADKLNNFFIDVFKNDGYDKTPRRIMNQIVHLVSIANDIEQIRPKRDSLRIVFLQSCIESIYKLSGDNGGKYSKRNKANFWSDMLSEEGKQYILDSFRFFFLEPAYELDDYHKIIFDKKGRYQLSIEDFGLIIFKIRGMVLHEGDYWSMQFFASDIDSEWLVAIESEEEIVSFHKPEKNKPIKYHFGTTMQYEKFIYYFVQGCINFLYDYIRFKNI